MDVGSYYFVLDMPIPPWVYYMCKLKQTREGHLMIEKLEALLDWGGTKRDIVFLIISGIALVASIAGLKIGGVDPAWVAIILCGIPIILEAIIGLVTAFDIKADVLVSLALVASIIIGEDFAAGEVAFIMQLGALLEELTVARARAGIEKLVHLTPRTARGDYEIEAEQPTEDAAQLRMVNINTAGVDELDSLPGIGPVLAQRIVDWRTENGPFTDAAQLLEVDGIGQTVLESIQDFIVTEDTQE